MSVKKERFDDRVTVGGLEELLRRAREIFPSVAGAEFLEGRVGFRPATPDGMPVVASGDNYVIFTGHYRNGILWAPVSAKIVLDLLEKGEVSEYFRIFSPSRFQEKDHIVKCGPGY